VPEFSESDRHGKKGVIPMVISYRHILALGVGLAGAGLLAFPALVRGQGDSRVRQTATNTSEPPKLTPPVAPIIGTIDIEAVFKNYDKTKVSKKEIESKVMARKAELMKIMQDAQQETEMLQKLTPGTADYRTRENRVTELKAKYEASRELAQRELSGTEAEMFASMYKEVQAMVAKVAQWRGMTYIVKISNRPVSGNDPDSVMAAMNNLMVYADPRNDITNHVVHNLNRFYLKTAPGTEATTTKPAAPRGPAATAGGTPPQQ
jgi:Skp family chaperone for outer membrane proteins